MVTQPIYYFRFDQTEWLNPDTYTVETFLKFVNRYYISESVTQYNTTEDVDYKADTITFTVTKSFFNNPTGNSAYENDVDPDNAFSPQTYHAVVIGPMQSSNNIDSYNDILVYGSVTAFSDSGSDKYQITCSGLINILSNIQAGTEYKYDNTIQINDYVQDNVKYLADDTPNQLQLFYNDAYYQTRAEKDKVYIWNRKNESDPAFPAPDTGDNKYYPFAVYSMRGAARTDGNATFRIMHAYDTDMDVYSIPFKVGDPAELVLSKMLQYNINSNVNTKTVPDLYVKGNIDQLNDATVVISTELLRMSQHNDCLVVQSRYNKTDTTKQYYLNDLPSGYLGVSVPEGSGFEVDYIYYGKSVSSDANEQASAPESGRPKILNADTSTTLTTKTAPFYPMDLYGFNNLKVDDGTVIQRNYFLGYSLEKVVWRMLEDLGWCRYPFFPDCNPYCPDYDENHYPYYYETYKSDGMEMDFPFNTLKDFNEYLYLPYYTAFDASKQPYAYNFKTISDAQSMLLNAQIRPLLEDNIPVWDDSVYNPPTWATFEVQGYCPDVAPTMIMYLPDKKADGTIYMAYVYVHNLDRCSRREIASKMEAALRADKNLSNNYNIVRYGTKIYIETYDLEIANYIKNDLKTHLFAVEVDKTDTNLNSTSVNINYHLARTDETERQSEKIYYLRRWGITPGFHPTLFIKMPLTERLIEPEVDYEFDYSVDQLNSDVTKPTIMGKPNWSTITSDVINKAIVKYSSTDSSVISNVVFPATTKQYKSFAIRLKGITSGECTAFLTLTIGDAYSGTIKSYLSAGYSASTAAASFDERVIAITVGENTYQFPVSANGECIYVYSDIYSNNFLLDTSQLNFVVELKKTTGSEVVSLSCDKKELVDEEPVIFDDARDSQSLYGIREMSLTMPESKSINDTMAYVAHIFKKYLNPKYKCVATVSQPDGWHIPLHSYCHIRDYANGDTTTTKTPWYAEGLFSEKSNADQYAIISFSYSDGTSARAKVRVGNGDTPEQIAEKIKAFAESEDAGELGKYTINTNGGQIELYPIIGFNDTISLYPTPPQLPADYVDTSTLDYAGAGKTTSPATSGGSSSGGTGESSSGSVKVVNGLFVDSAGNALPKLRGICDAGTLPLMLAGRGGVVYPGSTGIISYSGGVDTSSEEDIAKFAYNYGKGMLADSKKFNLVRIGCHDHYGTDRAWTTYAYDVANGTTHFKTVLNGLAKGFEAAGVYYSFGPFAGFSDTNPNTGQQMFFSRTLSLSKTSIDSVFVNGTLTSDSSYQVDNLLNKDSTSAKLFAQLLTFVCDVVGNYPHLLAVEMCNESDLAVHKDKWWWPYYGGTQAKAQAAYRAWISYLVSTVKAGRSKTCLLTNGSTPFDGNFNGDGLFWNINGTVSNASSTILYLNEACDVTGIHIYHIPIELTNGGQDWWNQHHSDYPSDSYVHMDNFFTGLHTACVNAGRPAYVTEWGTYLSASQAWVDQRAVEMEGQNIPHACIKATTAGGVVSVPNSYELPSDWDEGW